MNRTAISSSGFSLLELLTVLLVVSLLIGSVLSFFENQRDSYVCEDLKLERDQNLRSALEMVVSEFSTAGLAAADSAFIERLSIWVSEEYVPAVPLSVTLDANPKITQGEGELPDMITFLCLVPTQTNPAALSEKSEGGVLVLTLSKTETAEQFRENDLLRVGTLSRYARVAGIDGKKLYIDTDPETAAQDPLPEAYPAGAPVGEVSVVSYAVFNDGNDPSFLRHEAGIPCLKRKVNAAGFYPVADNISRMKITSLPGGGIRISLTAQTDGGRMEMKGIRPITLAADVTLRNAVSPSFADDCGKPAPPEGLSIHGGLDQEYPCGLFFSWEEVTADASGNDLEEAGCPVTSYRVYYDSVPGVFGNHVDLSSEEASGTLLDVSELFSSEVYMAVAAMNSDGVGERSIEKSISDDTPPAPPGNLSAGKGASGEILLTWEENPECDLAGYLVYRKKGGGAFEPVETSLIPKAVGGYTDAGLEEGFLYIYYIEAVDFAFNRSEASHEVSLSLP